MVVKCTGGLKCPWWWWVAEGEGSALSVAVVLTKAMDDFAVKRL